MATIKSYTDLEQSKKLAEILSIESADMSYYTWKNDGHLMSPVPFVLDGTEVKDGMFEYIPCWSLAVLFGIIKSAADYTMQSVNCKESFIVCELGDKPWNITAEYDNEIDACVEMILKLNELNLL